MQLFENGEPVKHETGRSHAGWTDVFIMYQVQAGGTLQRAKCVSMPAREIKNPFKFTTNGTTYEFKRAAA